MRFDSDIEADEEAYALAQSLAYQQAAAQDWATAPAMEPYQLCVACLILIAAASAYQEAAATQAWIASAAIVWANGVQTDRGGANASAGHLLAAGGLVAEAAPWAATAGAMMSFPAWAPWAAGTAAAAVVASNYLEDAPHNRPIVIGENMARVNAAAAVLHAQTYPGFGREEEALPAHASDVELNRAWIQEMMRQGRTIYDIDIDTARDVRSEFYRVEQEETSDYPYRRAMYWPPGGD